MRIACCQFASGFNINDNLKQIKDMVNAASYQSIDLICFHECALCGYPPVETSIDKLNEKIITEALEEVSTIAAKNQINVLLGTVLFENERRYNSALVFSPNGQLIARYDKKALWGWDRDNFVGGSKIGIFEIAGTRIGIRICFDIRFPELFRELYDKKVNLCIVLFSDTSEEQDLERYEIIKGHIRTRAVENVMTIISTNSIFRCQTAPTAVIDQNGYTLAEAIRDQNDMIFFEYEVPDIDFGMQGRIENNRLFIK